VTEALARGLPVVAAEVGGVPEALGRGADGSRPGLLVPPGDAAAIAGALRLLAADPALRERLGAAGRQRVLDEFDVEASADELARRFGAEPVS